MPSYDSHIDIISLILEDHRPLKSLLRSLKNLNKDFDERQQAFAALRTFYRIHTKAEEQSLYKYILADRTNNLREAAMEAEVEHQVAQHLIDEINATKGSDLWAAQAKVLAEILEDHIQDEEVTLLPEFRYSTTDIERMRLGQKYLLLKTQLMDHQEAEISF